MKKNDVKKLGQVHVRYICHGQHADAERLPVNRDGQVETDHDHTCRECGQLVVRIELWTIDGEDLISARHVPRHSGIRRP
jgi:hypothetical protein